MKKENVFKGFYLRFETLIKYSLLGTGTSIINFLTYYILIGILPLNRTVLFFKWWEIANISAWAASNVYSYIVNSKFVFKSDTQQKRQKYKEIFLFFALRAVSLFLSMQIMALLIETLLISHNAAKLAGMFIEVFVNYLTCKMFVFKKKK